MALSALLALWVQLHHLIHLHHLILQAVKPASTRAAMGNDDLPVLFAQLVRIILFNLYGTFVGIEQIRQMRLNFWQVRLLGEPVLRSCLGNEALAGYLGVLLQVVLGIDSVPPLVPVDEPDHVN